MADAATVSGRKETPTALPLAARALRLAVSIARSHPSSTIALSVLGVLVLDFAAGRRIEFPLLYLAPVALAAWIGRPGLAYGLAGSMPLLRVLFERLWHVPESLPLEVLNAVLESAALALYVPLIRRQSTRTRQMRLDLSAREEETEHLRAFARSAGATLQGRPISPGMAEGLAHVYLGGLAPPVTARPIPAAQVPEHLGRLERAMAGANSELEETGQACVEEWPEGPALVETQLAMLRDPGLAEACRQRIREDRMEAAQAVAAEIRALEQKLLGLNRPYMAARAADLRDLGQRILRQLADPPGRFAHPLAVLEPGTVVVAEDLLLTDALQMDVHNVAAIVTERTGPASHAAILARSKRIPALCDIQGAATLLKTGDRLLVDAERGTVIVAPTPTQGARFAARKARSLALDRETADPGRPCVTRDGVRIDLLGNIAHPDEAVTVIEHGLKGVGLFRSELLFLQSPRPPDLESQVAAYDEVAAMLHPRPVIVRTMDFGGDKIPAWAAAATDPALGSGLRGLAYSLGDRASLRIQLQAIARAARRGNVRVLFPMVTGAADLREARALVTEAIAAEGGEIALPVGAMIETPAAAFAIDELLESADYVSIGTNDLSHSILGMDRGSAGHDGVAAFLHPSVLRAALQVIQAARRRGRPLTLCGEAAADPALVGLLVGLGVRELSLSPFFAARVRHAIRDLTVDRAQSLAKAALGKRNAAEIRRLLVSAHAG